MHIDVTRYALPVIAASEPQSPKLRALFMGLQVQSVRRVEPAMTSIYYTELSFIYNGFVVEYKCLNSMWRKI